MSDTPASALAEAAPERLSDAGPDSATDSGLRATLGLDLRLALRDLRGGLVGFRLFLICLALGVGAIAAVGSLSEALVASMKADGAKLLGGDVELRLTHIAANAEQRQYLEAHAEAVSHIVSMRTMASNNAAVRTLVELKAVDSPYPLYGELIFNNQTIPQLATTALLERRDGKWGAAADPGLLQRLDLSVGDDINVGEAVYQVRALIETEPDRGSNAFVLGPRLMVGADSLKDTGLIQEGSLIRYLYRMKLAPSQDLETWLTDLSAAYPKAGWRIRDLRNGAPGLKRFLDRMRLFLTLVGLTALLVGGLGVANAVRAYLDRKVATIATLKCLGASSSRIFRIYLFQILILAFMGISLGLLFGALMPWLVGDIVARYLPITSVAGIYPGPLGLAAIFGLLTAVAFALHPLATAKSVAPGALFRQVIAPVQARHGLGFWILLAAAFGSLAALAILTAEQWWFAAWFVAAAAAVFLLFYLAALAIQWLAARTARPQNMGLRLALASLHRPGTAVVSIVCSFGLGLSVLVTVMMLEGNIAAQIGDRLPEEAPAFFFLDIQPDQIDAFTDEIGSLDGVAGMRRVPSLRGRISAVNGVPSEALQPAPEVEWALRGDRGLTYAASAPENTEIVAGEWWPADYDGLPLLSLDAEVAKGFNIGLGDRITVNVLGREISAEIANLRRIDWTTFGINYIMVFSPNMLRGAPHTYIATANAEIASETAVEALIAADFRNVTVIRVREALAAANQILANIGTAVRGAAAITLVAGLLVLAGAVAAQHRRRVYDAVVLKVLGATRIRIILIFLTEFLILGLVAAVLAVAVGSSAAYIVMTEVMSAKWVWLPDTAFITAAVSLTLTLVVGVVATLAALNKKPAPLLRNE